MERMEVTKALNELNTLDKRINRVIDSARFVAPAKTCEKKVDPTTTKDDFSKEAFSSYDSVNDLIKRRETIKAAIIESNAKTKVNICGEEYTVAKVIDLKSSIEYKRMLLNSMKRQFASSKVYADNKNAEVARSIEQAVISVYGKDSKSSIKDSDYESIANPIRTANEYSIVDPLNIKEKIESLENWIEEFEATCDGILQISNCTTMIEF